MPTFSHDWFPAAAFEDHLRALKGREGMRFLEIGAFEGRGTLYLLEKFLGKTGTIACIDPFIDYSKATVAKIHGYDKVINESSLNRFLENTAAFKDRISLHQGLSKDVLPGLPASSFDVAFVDGDHSRDAVAVDARECFRLVKKGGYIVFDDYQWGVAGRPETSPKEAIDRFLNLNERHLRLLFRGWCVVVQKL